MMKYIRWSQKEKHSWLGFASLLRFRAIKEVFLKNKIILFDYHLFAHCVILDKLQTCMREMGADGRILFERRLPQKGSCCLFV